MLLISNIIIKIPTTSHQESLLKFARSEQQTSLCKLDNLQISLCSEAPKGWFCQTLFSYFQCFHYESNFPNRKVAEAFQLQQIFVKIEFRSVSEGFNYCILYQFSIPILLKSFEVRILCTFKPGFFRCQQNWPKTFFRFLVKHDWKHFVFPKAFGQLETP